MKHLFIDADIVNTFDSKQTVIQLNGVLIQAYPSDHLDDARGIANVSFIYVDEAAFFQKGEQQNLRDVIERYLIKSNPWIVLTSTPNKPTDIMAEIMNEPNSLYKKLYFDYRVGIGKMWMPQEIELQKQSPSFQREFNLKFLGEQGDIFSAADINYITNDPYSTREYSWTTKYMGVDPGWGSSETGIVILQLKDGKLEIVFADSYPRPVFTHIVAKVRQLATQHKVCKIYVDGSAANLIRELKHGYGSRTEYINYHLLTEDIIRQWETGPCEYNKVCPVNFRTRHKDMLSNLIGIVQGHHIRITPKFDKLIVALRTAKQKGDLDYDKRDSTYSDILDATMLSCIAVKWRN